MRGFTRHDWRVPKQPQPRKPRQTRASSKLRKALAPPVTDLDDADQLAHDEQLALFLRRPPLGAERVVIVAHTSAGERVVEDRAASEARAAPVQLANATLARCERWARTEKRETRFRAEWRAGDRTLASHQWQAGEGGDPTALDGTAESIISQMQRHVEARDRVHLEHQSEQNAGWRDLVNELRAEIRELRADNQVLREKRRKADDVETEMALARLQAEIESKGQTMDIVQHQLLPLVQAVAVEHMKKGGPLFGALGGGTAAPAAESGNTPKQ